jgi:hypothetical protein
MSWPTVTNDLAPGCKQNLRHMQGVQHEVRVWLWLGHFDAVLLFFQHLGTRLSRASSSHVYNATPSRWAYETLVIPGGHVRESALYESFR